MQACATAPSSALASVRPCPVHVWMPSQMTMRRSSAAPAAGTRPPGRRAGSGRCAAALPCPPATPWRHHGRMAAPQWARGLQRAPPPLPASRCRPRAPLSPSPPSCRSRREVCCHQEEAVLPLHAAGWAGGHEAGAAAQCGGRLHRRRAHHGRPRCAAGARLLVPDRSCVLLGSLCWRCSVLAAAGGAKGCAATAARPPRRRRPAAEPAPPRTPGRLCRHGQERGGSQPGGPAAHD